MVEPRIVVPAVAGSSPVGHPGVAFLDLKMPGMSGIDFLREAKPTPGRWIYAFTSE
jgi:CheY-like chemotaxis protein